MERPIEVRRKKEKSKNNAHKKAQSIMMGETLPAWESPSEDVKRHQTDH